MRHFLLIYNAAVGKLETIHEFEDEQRAVEEFTRLEWQYFNDARFRIVLLSGESRASIEKTHGNFFEPPDAVDAIDSVWAAK